YAWKSRLLYFRGPLLVELLRRYMQSQGRDLPFNWNDLRAQMRTRDYWKEPKGNEHKQRFGGNKSPHSCCCIRLDAHPLGFQPAEDDVFGASVYKDGKPGGELVAPEKWIDPRRGDLFPLVDMLIVREVSW